MKSLENILDHDDYPCHLKCAETGRYLYTNVANTQAYKMTEKDFIGLTIYDLYDALQWDDWFYAEALESENRLISTKKQTIVETPGFKRADGLMLCEKRIKTPIHNNKGKIIAIFTKSIIKHSANLVDYLNKTAQLSNLSKKSIVAQMLYSLDLGKCFFTHDSITYSEMSTLFALSENNNCNKHAAIKLRISEASVRKNKSIMKDKCKENLDDVIRLLSKKIT